MPRLKDIQYKINKKIMLLHYIIDLDERGIFKAHVEDPDGNILYEISEDDDDFLFKGGWMKHKHDIKGLEQYLKSLGIIIEKDQSLVTEDTLTHL